MGLKTESMRSNTMFIYDISVYLDNNANNNVYFYLKLMLFSLGRCQLRIMHLPPSGSHTMFVSGILVHLDTVYLDV